MLNNSGLPRVSQSVLEANFVRFFMMTNILQDDVDRYLERIVAAGIFEKDSLRHRLLKHLILAELAGEGANLKAYTIGLDVFGKPESFDPSTDSSVRVGVGRLRTSLALFESGDGAATNIVVDIPVGTYRPQITRRDMTAGAALAANASTENSVDAKRRMSPLVGLAAVAVFAFVGWALLTTVPFFGWRSTVDTQIALEVDAFKGDPALAAEVTTTLRRGLSRNKSITVVADSTAGLFSDETDLVLQGSVARTDEGRALITAELLSVSTGNIVWAKALDFEDDALLQSRITQVLGNELRVRVFGATKQELAGRDPETLTPEQLFIMGTWVPGRAVNAVTWELSRVQLMGLALEKDPEFGAAHSVMADKLAYLANVYGPSDTPELREAALMHAQSARELSPLNPDVMFNVAQALWHSGQIRNSEAAMLRVLDLDPGHDVARFLAKMIPNTCDTPSQDVVDWAVAFDARLSADNPIRWLTLTWIGWLHTNRGEYVLALDAEEKAALIFEIPYTFMRHAMLLNKLDRTDEAISLIESQTRNWPSIDPDHFAQVTLPRLCAEDENHPELIQNYQELADAVAIKG